MINCDINEVHEQQFENLILGLNRAEFGVCDSFLNEETVKGLRTNLENYYDLDLMHPAGVGKNFDYVKNTKIRGDVIKWIDEKTNDVFEKAFLEKVTSFITYLNETCFTGINDFEFHYAYYEKGSFYKRHLDQFKADKGRLFSFVIYLNDNWSENDGGKLSVYTVNKESSISPKGGKAVFFRSDVTEHEVHPSHTRPRLSIAGWLKKV